MMVLLAFGTLRGGMQRDALFGDAPGVADQVERFDQLVALQHVLAAEAIRIGALLDFGARETGGHDSRAGLHLDLMNRRAGAGGEQLLDAAEGHRAFGDGDALHAAHFLVRGEQQIDLLLDGNAERILEKRILPGVHVGFFGRERDIFALRERGGLGDRDGFGGAGLHAFARQPVGRGKSPRAAGDHANADAERFGFGERADFAVLGRNVAMANVHHAHVGVGSAAALRGFDREIG